MKKILPHKLIIEFEKGLFKEAIIMYRINIDGNIENKFKTISVKNSGHSVPQLNTILKKMITHTNKAEGIEDGE